MLKTAMNVGIADSPMTFHPPSSMLPVARLQEIGRILAAGYRRLAEFRESGGNRLDDLTAESPHDGRHASDKEAA